MLSEKTTPLWADPVLENVRTLILMKEYIKERTKGNSAQFFNMIFAQLEQFCGQENSPLVDFIKNGTQDKFYPLVLINNSRFAEKDYFYALSKRVHILSLPYKTNTRLHGGYFQEPTEVLFHDIAHLHQFRQFREGRLPFSFIGQLKDNVMIEKCNMYQRVGAYFFELLQSQDIDHNTKKKLREIGFNLTHENWSRGEVEFPVDSTIQSDIQYLIQCLRINLKNEFLPDCLLNTDAFKSSLADSYIMQLKLTYPDSIPNDVRENDIFITDADIHLTYNVSYRNIIYDGDEGPYHKSAICYEFLKRTKSDWVKSAQRAGYEGHVSDDNMEYNPTEARKFHLSMLDWFEEKYL